MDLILKDMDFLSKHWAACPRRCPSMFPIGSVGAISSKSDWVHRAFRSCNFSVILRGTGEFRRNGIVYPVEAPCVLTQWPGERPEYGPGGPEGTWDELYLMYDSSLFLAFQKCRLIDPAVPLWPIRNLAGVRAQIDALAALSRSDNPDDAVDRVDRVCERLLLESWLTPPGVRAKLDDSSAIQSILDELLANLGCEMDLDELALRHGMSPATFRRHWRRIIGIPPARYRLEQRLREACRLLAETARPIREIARAVGFDDELYFSRRFHREMGQAPRDYRRLYQILNHPGGGME